MAQRRNEHPAGPAGRRRGTTSSAPPDAGVTLVEYGSYACPYCRAANDRIAEARDRLGDRMLYVFRHKPLTGSDIARRAAELVERAPDAGDLLEGARHPDDALRHADRGRPRRRRARPAPPRRRRARPRPPAPASPPTSAAPRRAACSSPRPSSSTAGATTAPGTRAPSATPSSARSATGCASRRSTSPTWAPSTGLLLLLATLLALVLTNSPLGPGFAAFWHAPLGIAVGGAGFGLSLLALGQRRAAHRLLPRRRPRDQARVHRRAPRRACARPRCRSPRRSAAWSRRR